MPYRPLWADRRSALRRPTRLDPPDRIPADILRRTADTVALSKELVATARALCDGSRAMIRANRERWAEALR
jgi:hypothetical protein